MEFFDYFEQVYGDRWPALLEALKGEGNAVRLQFGETLEPYFLDEASVFAAKFRSPDRRLRLRHVIENSLPPQWRSIINITGYDGVKFGLHRKESYDRILLDAPCSSDRHVLQSPTHLAEWSAKRVKRLSVEQGSLLASAVDALRPGGEVVYGTCALAPLENDAVVAKILKKRPAMEVVRPDNVPEWAECTEFGYHVLPDRAGGCGPIYCARLRKR